MAWKLVEVDELTRWKARDFTDCKIKWLILIIRALHMKHMRFTTVPRIQSCLFLRHALLEVSFKFCFSFSRLCAKIQNYLQWYLTLFCFVSDCSAVDERMAYSIHCRFDCSRPLFWSDSRRCPIVTKVRLPKYWIVASSMGDWVLIKPLALYSVCHALCVQIKCLGKLLPFESNRLTSAVQKSDN